jgi:adenylate kinase
MHGIVLLGAPGAGKGTQAVLLAKDLDVAHISSGDLFRENIKAETDLGKLAKQYIDRGELVPDEVTIEMVRDRISRPDCAKGFILDGFPRTIPQADALDRMLTDKKMPLNAVIWMYADRDVLVERILKRAQEGGAARGDDNADVVRKRLEVYRQQTEPLVYYYQDKGLLKVVGGMEPIEAVTQRIRHVLGA